MAPAWAWIKSETRTWHDDNIQSIKLVSQTFNNYFEKLLNSFYSFIIYLCWKTNPAARIKVTTCFSSASTEFLEKGFLWKPKCEFLPFLLKYQLWW